MVLGHFLLLQLLGNLGLDVIELGQLRVTHVIQTDDVVTELRLDRGVGHFPFGQFGHGVRKFGHKVTRASLIEVATFCTRARVFAGFFGDFIKFATLFKLGNDGFGFIFFFHQNMAGAVLFAAVGRGKSVVFSL